MKRLGKSVILVDKNYQQGRQMDFMAVKKARRRSIFVIDSYLKDSAFTAVKGCKVLN